MNNFAISLVITAHNEGLLAHRSVNSAISAIAYAALNNIEVELMAVLDNPSNATKAYFNDNQDLFNCVYEVDFKDTGPARNYAVKKALGEYIAFLDADDLISQNWLLDSYKFITQSQNANTILHPNYLLFFGMVEDIGSVFKLQEVIDCNHKEYNSLNLIEHNYWSALCFTSKANLLAHPYKTMTPGFGYEDWEFNIDTVAAGIKHHIVPDTIHFIRQKSDGSRSQASSIMFTTILPNRLFELPNIDQGNGNKHNAHQQINQESLNKFKLSFALRKIYRNLKPYLQVLKDKNIRLYRFLATVAAEAIIPAVKAILTRHKAKPIEPWILAQWNSISEFEPNLRHDFKNHKPIRTDWIQPSVIAKYYPDLLADYGTEISHVFLLPWLNPGGADLVSINYINCLVEQNYSPVVILTNNIESTWLGKLPEPVKVIEFGKLYGHLNFEEQRNLLLRVLLQRPPQSIHNINSYLGYELFVKNGQALKQYANLFVSLFAPEILPNGRMSGYAIEYLPDCFDYLTGIFTDNKTVIEMLTQIYGYEVEKFILHYQPVNPKIDFKLANQKWQIKSPPKLNILWASRLDFEKRVDVLLKIVKNGNNDNYVFHVWGKSVLNEDLAIQELLEQSNVIYYGGFNSFAQIPVQNYDVFLYTSNWDGLPNILLEVIASGLPCIAPNVGGIKELIINNQTGFLVENANDYKSYLKCLQLIRENPELVNQVVLNARGLVSDRHNYENFTKKLSQNKSYFGKLEGVCQSVQD